VDHGAADGASNLSGLSFILVGGRRSKVEGRRSKVEGRRSEVGGRRSKGGRDLKEEDSKTGGTAVSAPQALDCWDSYSQLSRCGSYLQFPRSEEKRCMRSTAVQSLRREDGFPTDGWQQAASPKRQQAARSPRAAPGRGWRGIGRKVFGVGVRPAPASRLADESGSRLHAVQGLRREKTGSPLARNHGHYPLTGPAGAMWGGRFHCMRRFAPTMRAPPVRSSVVNDSFG
jgi:hypothetical protein